VVRKNLGNYSLLRFSGPPGGLSQEGGIKIIISKNNINNLCIFFSILLFLVISVAARPVFSATKEVDPGEDKNKYFEDFIQNWIKINASPSILEDIRPLLRYVVLPRRIIMIIYFFIDYALKGRN
jgi:hypothetical protein